MLYYWLARGWPSPFLSVWPWLCHDCLGVVATASPFRRLLKRGGWLTRGVRVTLRRPYGSSGWLTTGYRRRLTWPLPAAVSRYRYSFSAMKYFATPSTKTAAVGSSHSLTGYRQSSGLYNVSISPRLLYRTAGLAYQPRWPLSWRGWSGWLQCQYLSIS